MLGAHRGDVGVRLVKTRTHSQAWDAEILSITENGAFNYTAEYADPTPIVCPTGQTVFLEGRTIPGEALLIYLSGRAVGGGLADSSGGYRLTEHVKRYYVTARI